MANLNLSQFGENTSVSNADYTFVWDSAASISKKVSRNSWLNSGTLTSDAPVTISQTWNAGSNVMTALKVVATDTASGATSNLLELWAGSTPALDFAVTKAGVMQAYGTYSSAGANYARLALACDSSGNATISTQALGTGTAGVLAFSPGNSERMRITTAGNVGIGTTAPSTFLEVALPASGSVINQGIKLSRGAGYFSITNGSSTNNFFGVFYAKGTLDGSALAAAFNAVSGNDSDTANPVMVFVARNNADTAAIGNTQTAFQFRNYATNLISVLGSGNVGIGTTSPTSKLQVSAGDVEVDTIAKGVILKSPDGTRYRVTVANGGTLSVAAV